MSITDFGPTCPCFVVIIEGNKKFFAPTHYYCYTTFVKLIEKSVTIFVVPFFVVKGALLSFFLFIILY